MCGNLCLALRARWWEGDTVAPALGSSGEDRDAAVRCLITVVCVVSMWGEVQSALGSRHVQAVSSLYALVKGRGGHSSEMTSVPDVALGLAGNSLSCSLP